ncbi:MAG: helix-turn-helix transcriptional regulator [Clostridium sp.]
MKSNMLKSERIKNGFTQKDLAKALKIDVTSYSKRETGIVEFKLNEVIHLKEILNLTPKSIDEIFFDNKLELKSS